MSQQDYQAFIDKTSADPTQAGFDFQFYTFVYLVLKMEVDSIVEYETDDDLVYIRKDGAKHLIQAKFAVLDKNGVVPNMTTRDVEVWHTIHNWIKASEALADGTYFTSHKFSIWTDKNFENNSFFNLILSYQNRDIEFSFLEKELENLISKTSDGKDPKKTNEVKIAMEKLKALSTKDKKSFYLNFSMNCFPTTSIIEKIKLVLEQEKYIPSEKVQDVFDSLISEIKENRFYEIFKRDKTKIQASDFSKKYKRCFNKVFNRNLNIVRSLNLSMPENICSNTFVKQLLDVQVIYKEDIMDIQEMYRKKMCTRMSIDKWKTDGDMLNSEEDEIERIAYHQWDVEHKSCHNKIKAKKRNDSNSISDNEYNEAASSCYFNICKKKIDYNSGSIDEELTTGYFYEMSDEPRIGWHYDWEQKYKKQNK